MTSTPRDFSVWAPAATTGVHLVLGETTIPLQPQDDGWWHVSTPAEAGARYAFKVDDEDPVSDPRAISLPDGPHGPAEVIELSTFEWTDEHWRGVELEGSVIYEMHVGTFTPGRTFDSAIERLDHLVALGIDIVQVMPVAAFPGKHGWGYDGVFPWAVHAPYGGPVAFQRFVDAAHARGLGVFLDVVYNHLGPDGNYLSRFGPFFHDHYSTPWGQALNLDGEGSDGVRLFVLGNALSWFTAYHLDGLRLDAVHELHDDRAVHILEELALRAAKVSEETGVRRWLVAESDRNDPRTVIPSLHNGLGMDAQWADDIHHGMHVALTGESHGYYADFAAPGALAKVLTTPFFHDGTYSSFRGRTHGRAVDGATLPGWRFVASLQTHDQVGNRRAGDRLGHVIGVRRLKIGAALLLTSPYTPMLFMGEEFDASTPWQFFTDHIDSELAEAVSLGRREEFARHGWTPEEVPDPQDVSTVEASTLEWAEADAGRDDEHGEVLRWYKALLALRRSRPDLRDSRLDQVVVREDADRGTLVIDRGDHRVAVNLSDQPVTLGVHPARGSTVLLAGDPTVVLNEEGYLDLPGEGVAIVGPATVPEQNPAGPAATSAKSAGTESTGRGAKRVPRPRCAKPDEASA